MFRNFGIEIEVYNISIQECKNVIKKNGFLNWKVDYDHSICGCETLICSGKCLTAEIISPILNNEKDLEKIEKICNILKDNNAKINNSCGFHVHIDAETLSAEQIEMVYRRYALYERAIDLLHPKNRRGNTNNYCLSIKPIIEIMDEDKIQFISKETITKKLFLDKYYKLNLVSLDKYGSLEFRQHKGSLDFDEIKNWIYFCQEFIENSITPGIKDSLFRGINGKTKQYYMNLISNA